MLGRNHVWLSCTSLVLLVTPWLLAQPVAIGLFVIGAWIGALLPDVDSVNGRIFHSGQVPGFVGRGARWVLFRLVGLLFWLIRTPFEPKHRGSMHTVIGIAFYTGVITGVAYGACALATSYTGVPYWSDAVWPVVIGLIAGGVFHLIEDSCTVRGIQPFLPIWGHWFHGGITTGNSRDKRPEIYGTVLFGEIVGVLVVQQYLHYPQTQVVLMAASALIASWVIFYLISKVPIRAPSTASD